MTLYRLCYINPRTGQVDRERSIDALDDVDAVHNACACHHRPLELWCGERRVKSLENAPNPPMHA